MYQFLYFVGAMTAVIVVVWSVAEIASLIVSGARARRLARADVRFAKAIELIESRGYTIKYESSTDGWSTVSGIRADWTA